jgi:hypothetical protein
MNRVNLRLPVVIAVAVWLTAGAVMGSLTSRVADWFVMTDELLYERLAISIVRWGSLVPHVHREVVPNLNQLYPIVLAWSYRDPSIHDSLHDAHLLNAFIMTSAAVPAFFLARRVTSNAWAGVVVAFLSVALPWLVLASFLLTEVVAYPVFLWAMLAGQRALANPTRANDGILLAALGAGVLARTQFIVLAGILLIAIAGLALAEGEGSYLLRLRSAGRAHIVLLAGYAVVAVIALVLLASGHNPLGTYRSTATGGVVPANILPQAAAHLAVLALATGFLPFIVGGGWLVSNLARATSRERNAFAWLATSAVVVLTLEVTSFNLRFGGGVVRDRYLFYLAPLLLVALAAGLTDRLPKWSIALPLAIVVVGFIEWHPVAYSKLNVDTPASIVVNWLLDTMKSVGTARLFLIASAILLAVVYLEGALLLGRRVLVPLIVALLLVALPAETAYAFKRLFAVNGTSGLPLTLDQSVVFSWVDREITTNSEAMMIPYPVLRADYWANVGFWWDLEFWNRSVDREGGTPGMFEGTPAGTFPKIALRFDPHTGRANADFDSYVAQAVAETRFHIAGRQLTTQRDVSIVFPDRPWHADWTTNGLYPDGWTVPAHTAHIVIYPRPGVRQAEARTITVSLLAPGDVTTRNVTLAGEHFGVGPTTTTRTLTVCVRPDSPASVKLSAEGSSSIYGIPSSPEAAGRPRAAGVLVQQIALADATGAHCAS